jgi:hypothetical protein
LPGSFVVRGSVGVNHVRFTGRLAGVKLKVGKYSLVATPSTSRGAGQTASASFEIVR